jgi:AcrR family transcriptional regulator
MRTATQLFSDRGFHGTGIRDLAEGAGLAMSAMYYYASSKDELLDRIMRTGMSGLIEGGGQALEGVEGASERLATLVRFHIAMHIANPHTTRVVDQEFRSLTESREEILGLRDQYARMWGDILAYGVSAGEFLDRGGLDKLALIEMCTGVVHWYSPRGPLTPADLCDRFADMALSLVGATRDSGPVQADQLSMAPLGDLMELVHLETEPVAMPGRAI